MPYKTNPKTDGSGIIAVIPHHGECPNKCGDCFYQSERSFLEPLDENTPNMCPVEMTEGRLPRIVRVNDGHDSGVNPEMVKEATAIYKQKFYNTCLPRSLNTLTDAPVVLTLNPAKMTNTDFHRVWYPNLMMVRFRINTWNLNMADWAVQYYADRQVPIIMTFMAYYKEEGNMPEDHKKNYEFRERTTNSYFAIKNEVWREIMSRWDNTPAEKWVYSCSKVEGAKPIGDFRCSRCGNCLREYYRTMERLIAMEWWTDPNQDPAPQES